MTPPASGSQTRRLLVVCTANACRSYMAAAYLARRAREAALPIAVSSAGTHVADLSVDPDAVVALAEQGIEAPLHEPRAVDRHIVQTDGADLIIGMTREHVREVVAIDRTAWTRTFTLRELVRRMTVADAPSDDWTRWLDTLGEGRRARDLMTPHPDDDIADPYGRSLDEHRRCLMTMGGLIDQLLSSSPLGRR